MVDPTRCERPGRRHRRVGGRRLAGHVRPSEHRIPADVLRCSAGRIGHHGDRCAATSLDAHPRAAVATALAVGLVAGAAIAWWPYEVRRNSTSTGVFARGLSDDLQLVADQASAGDVVVAYHLSGPYVRDRLLNADDVARDVQVVDEVHDPRVLDVLTTVVATETDTVWCVIPYEAGPEASMQACDLDDSWVETLSVSLTRAGIVRLDRRS